jgi:hypothetical protein
MVLIVASLAAVLIAASGAVDPQSLVLPLRVVIVATPAMNKTFSDNTLTEAAQIWRSAGLAIEWRNRAGEASDAAAEVTVTFHDARTPSPNGNETLGWIAFAGPDTPTPDIHLSRGNALELMTRTASIRDVPAAWQEYLLARALGRALAHELGHYLLKARAHERTGLMRAARPSSDFFSASRSGFALPANARVLLARRQFCADF